MRAVEILLYVRKYLKSLAGKREENRIILQRQYSLVLHAADTVKIVLSKQNSFYDTAKRIDIYIARTYSRTVEKRKQHTWKEGIITYACRKVRYTTL